MRFHRSLLLVPLALLLSSCTLSGFSNASGVSSSATSLSHPSQCLVSFLNYDQSVLDEVLVNYGESVSYAGKTPAGPNNAHYHYTFKGWDGSSENVTEDRKLIATYERSVNQYAVHFLNYDGSELAESKVDYGTSATYEGAAPAKPSDEDHSYSWSGWDKDLSAIVEETTATATFTDESRLLCLFQNYDGTELWRGKVDRGGTIAYGGEKPLRGKDDDFIYTFQGWDKSLENISENTTFTAVYSTEARCRISFRNYDGSLLDEQIVDVGASLIYGGATPEKPKDESYVYTFSGWDKSLDNVQESMTLTAQFTATAYFTVTFLNADGTTLASVEVLQGGAATYEGATPSKPDDDTYVYTFKGWDVDLSNIQTNLSATAVYEATAYFTVAFVNDDGTALSSSKVLTGGTAVYQGETPTKAKDDKNYYTFKGWDQSLENITANLTIKAVYDAKAYYVVNFVNYDGSLLLSKEVMAGEGLTYDGATPTRPSDEHYKYTFKGWDVSLSSINATTTATATYESEERYSVTFVNYDDTVLTTIVVDKGASAAYEGAKPTKKLNDGYVYVFSGWDIDLSSITSNVTAKAQFTQTAGTFTCTFYANGTLLYTAVVSAGSTLAYAGATPTKDSIENFDYVFTGWDKSLEDIIADTVYTAQFKAVYTPLKFNGGTVSSCDSTATSVVIPDFHNGTAVTDIGYGVFQSHTALKNIAFGSNITNISGSCFSGCTGLSEITLPSRMTWLSDYCFANCISLSKVRGGGKITSIGNGAFADTPRLSEISFLANVTSFGSEALLNSGLATINLSAQVNVIGDDAFGNCQNLSAINVDAANPNFSSKDGVLYDHDALHLIQYPSGKSDSAYSLLSTTLKINKYAFYGAKNLVDLTLNDTLAIIDDYAFKDTTALGKITSVSSLTSVSSNAFDSSSGFLFDPTGKTISTGQYRGQTFSEFTIGEQVTSIGNEAFSGCGNLTSIVIPATVVSLGDRCFASCTRLKTVKFMASVPPTIGADVFSSTWDASDFTIQVPSAGLEAYKALTADFWQSYAVRRIVGY